MPVILEEKQFDAWLDDNAVPVSLVKMLKPASERVLAFHPVRSGSIAHALTATMRR
jgi:putative SOS response-associated peptidase YedK